MRVSEAVGETLDLIRPLAAERGITVELPGAKAAGLGLALSKRLTEAMGGTVGVKTVPGRGSTFWVRLPLSRAGATVVRETTPGHPSAASRPGQAACTLLYIKDNPSNRHLG